MIFIKRRIENAFRNTVTYSSSISLRVTLSKILYGNGLKRTTRIMMKLYIDDTHSDIKYNHIPHTYIPPKKKRKQEKHIALHRIVFKRLMWFGCCFLFVLLFFLDFLDSCVRNYEVDNQFAIKSVELSFVV